MRSLGVVGAGQVGSGVAQLAAARGLEVVLIDRDPAALDEARRRIEQSLERLIGRWALTRAEKKAAEGRIRAATAMAELRDVDFALECIPEDPAEKREVFRLMDQACPREAVLASSTATVSITELAASTFRPERVIGCHFLYPVLRSQVVEVVRGLKTDDGTVEAARSLLEQLGKVGIEVYEAPGFVTTRLILPLINEAAAILLEGVAGAESIDTAMRLGVGMSEGPLEFADRMGLDNVLEQMDRLWREYGDPRFRPSPLLRKLVRAGHLGAQTGQGFFRYSPEGARL